jgi:general stress protein YciG
MRKKKKQKRGLATASQETRIRVARIGGSAAHSSGNAHEFTTEEASKAGKKGGAVTGKNKKHMQAIGRLGALSRWKNKEKQSGKDKRNRSSKSW